MANFLHSTKSLAAICTLKSNRLKHGFTNEAEYKKLRVRGHRGSSAPFILNLTNAGDDSGGILKFPLD